MFASMLLFSLLNLRITQNAVNIGAYGLKFIIVISEIVVCVVLRIFLNGKLLLFGPEVFHSRELSIWGVLLYGMNELNLPTPGLYAKRKNLLMGSNPIIAPDSEMLWNAAIVWRILRRYEYTGALVMGRRKKIDVNTTSIRTLPEDKWIIA